jgi:predicted dehydrogenase
LADQIIIEEYFGQKIDDIHKYKADVFAIGSDWFGQFDYLSEFCEVTYLERTKGVSSTQLRNEQHQIVNLGIIGSSSTATGFMKEARYVSGVEVVSTFDTGTIASMGTLEFSEAITEFSKTADAFYIGEATPAMIDLLRSLLNHKKHVLYRVPTGLQPKELQELYRVAGRDSLVLLEAIHTAYSPGFHHLNTLIKSKKIGGVRDVAVSFPTLSSYCLLPIVKLLGSQYQNLHCYFASKDELDLCLRGIIEYKDAIATFQVGQGAKSEGSLRISGTEGYAYVPEPWWETQSFEFHYDNTKDIEKYFYKMVGNGLRYVLQEFIKLIQGQSGSSNKLFPEEAYAIYSVLDQITLEKGRKNAGQ